MEDAQAAQSGNSGKSKLQRYSLRSGTKSKEEKPPVAELSNSSASRRGRPASSVSKSVGVLDLSAKDKPAKPPRRLSIPAKPTASPAPKLVGNITPISETRVKRSATTSQGKTETPVSDVSRPSSRKRFSCILSSASYWLSQIKLSEAVAKHSVSLGFFKLALEAGCEPLQRMRDELKSYARRHNLSELGETVKELFERYNIVENIEQLQVSESCSQVPEEGTRSSDDEVRSSSSTVGTSTRKLKPKSLNTDAAPISPVTEPAKKDTAQKTNPATRNRGSLTKTNANSTLVSDTRARKSVKKPQNPSKQEPNKEKDIKKKGRKFAGQQGSVSPSTAENAPQENKENMDASSMEEISLTEVV
ncbi:uncharacterized protein LOC107419307 [Ziziphus jujuba]|uniref:Uncharacterized protein LOC107419307 n=1 Tax=Ziziphus jujuba TaxID=326968 RepID=A0A6P4AD19_ZIZJJ|nr:uncharacterized protein LOC107419307 [Ziziphus jujuba]